MRARTLVSQGNDTLGKGPFVDHLRAFFFSLIIVLSSEFIVFWPCLTARDRVLISMRVYCLVDFLSPSEITC